MMASTLRSKDRLWPRPLAVWRASAASAVAATALLFLAVVLTSCAGGGEPATAPQAPGAAASTKAPAGTSTAQLPATMTPGADPDYQLGAGDRLRVTVFGHQDLSGEFQVGSSGIISLPLIGEVKAHGRSLVEVEQVIVDKLSPQYLKNPRVNIEVLNYRPFYIIGQVNAPGSYPYVSGMRVVNAVALAGGYTYRAKESYVYITRNVGGEKEVLEAEPGDPVQPGDIIEVPERWF